MENLITAWLSKEELKKEGYEICTHCNGYGSSLKEKADKCTKCGGSGLTRVPSLGKKIPFPTK